MTARLNCMNPSHGAAKAHSISCPRQ